MAEEVSKSEVPKFSGSSKDWPLYKLEMRVYLMQHGIDIGQRDASGAIVAPTGTGSEKKKRIFATAMMLSIPRRWMLSYADCIDDGPKLFGRLERKYEMSDIASKMIAEDNLIRVKLQPGGDAERYIHSMRAAIETFSLAGGAPSDQDKVERLVNGLPREYSNVKDALDLNRAMSWDDAVDLIMRKMTRLEVEKRAQRASPDEAMRCKTCGRRGHRAATCRARVTDNRPKCDHCGRHGHNIAECRKKKAGESPSDAKPSKKGAPNIKKKKAMVANTDNESDDDYAMTSGDQHASEQRLEELHWTYDSGATNHVTPYRDILHDYEPINETIYGLASTVNVVGKGTVIAKVKSTSGKTVTIRFTALHVPAAERNLMSSLQCKKKGHSFHDGPKQSFLQLCGRSRPKKIQLVTYRRLPSIRLESIEKVDTVNVSVERWHQRLGHADVRIIKALPPAVDDMKITSKEEPNICEPCASAKMRMTPFPKKEKASRATEPGQRVFFDFQGPLPTVSRQGNRYVGMFIDDASRMRMVFFCRTKSAAPRLLKEYLRISRVDPSKMILRTDNASELTDGEFNDLVTNLGIKREFTCPDTPQQNAVVERALACMTADAKAMLSWSELPDDFWQDAFEHAARIRNRLTTKALDYKTPFEAWHGRKPKLGRFRVFGCVGYTFIPKDNRPHKLGRNAQPMIYIGFAAGVKGYKMYNPATGKTFASRSIRFDESCPGGYLVGEQVPEDDDDDYTEPEREAPEPPDRDAPDEDDNPAGTTPTLSRRPARTRKRPGQWWTAMLSYSKAMAGDDAPHWDSAVKAELASLENLNTWEVINRSDMPPGSVAIRTMWRLTEKRDKNGTIIRHKARLVARGDTQRSGVDYEEVFAPVASQHVLQIFCSIAVSTGMLLKHVDFTTAFLNADLKEEIYLLPPSGLHLPRGKVLRLRKSLYGLKQAGRNWFLCLHEFLTSIGFKSLECDVCVFVRSTADTFVAIATHVDDLLTLVDSQGTFDSVILELASRFRIGESGDLSHYCSIAIERDETSITLSQPYFTSKILDDFGMADCKPRSTPAEVRTLTKREPEEPSVDLTLYRQMVGCLIWLSTNTRPDIAFAVQQLSRFCSDPGTTHWQAAKAVLRYLRGPIRGLVYHKSPTLTPTAFCDADLGGDTDNRRSTLGRVTFMSGGPVLWGSIKPRNIVLSTAEAEYCSQSEGAKDIKFLSNLLTELGLTAPMPFIMKCDNQSAVAMAQRLKSSGRTRHIELKYHYVRQLVSVGLVRMDWIPSADMIADILTKPLPRIKFEQLCPMLVTEVTQPIASSTPPSTHHQ